MKRTSIDIPGPKTDDAAGWASASAESFQNITSTQAKQVPISELMAIVQAQALVSIALSLNEAQKREELREARSRRY